MDGCPAVDTGGAVPQVQRIGLAVTRAEDDHPPHVIRIDDLLGHVEWIEGCGHARVAGERVDACRIAGHHDVSRLGICPEKGGCLLVPNARAVPLRNKMVEPTTDRAMAPATEPKTMNRCVRGCSRNRQTPAALQVGPTAVTEIPTAHGSQAGAE